MIIFCMGVIFLSGFVLGGLIVENRIRYKLNYKNKEKEDI